MEKRRYIRRMLRMAALAVGMVLVGVASAWGQQNVTIVQNDIQVPTNALGTSTDTLFVVAGETYPIVLQYYNADNLNGYIRWYRESDPTDKSNLNNPGSLSEYANGFAWFNTSSSLTPQGACYINYRANSMGEDFEDVIVCEASALRNFGNTNNSRREASTITVRRRYVIRDAAVRADMLATSRTKLAALNNEVSAWLNTNVSQSAKLPTVLLNNTNNCRNLFKEVIEIHTPMEAGTNYRLEETLKNYCVNSFNGRTQYQPDRVRWRMYDAQGNPASGNYTQYQGNNSVRTIRSNGYVIQNQGDDGDNTAITENKTSAHILTYFFDFEEQKKDEQQIFYITAEVRYNEGTWYPVSFMTIYLEPFSETEIENDLSEERKTENIEKIYKKLASLTFEEGQSNLDQLTASTNYPQTALDANSYYAYAYPALYAYRLNRNRFVGRGEYALYRSLNYSIVDGWRTTNISNNTYGQQNPQDPVYNMYYARNYNCYVTDRLHDEDPSQYGYFLFLDAADEAGTITQISFSEALCPNTKIVVTAWVCNLNHGETDDSQDADVGFIFKGLNGSKETELNRFYTGIVTRVPEDGSQNKQKAEWKQVYFEFVFSGGNYNEYVLELTNNCRQSNGADYAIDDIRIYCSTPNINVGRVNACDASTLAVDTDFETILRNMGWNENQDVTTEFNFGILDFRKYRYGLMGTDHTNPTYNSKVGNAYFAFFGGSRQNPEWVAVNNSEEAANVPAVRNTIRVAISTDVSDIPASEEDALAAERELNCRAVEDYNAEIEEWKAENSTLHPDVIPDDNIRTDDNAYQTAIQTLYTRLGIPRIRCPWKETVNGQVVLHLTKLSVSETDMKYVGQDENDPDAGHYYVILFRASEVATGESGAVNPGEQCALVSEFSVAPATEILIEADADAETALCLGAYRKITPKLVVYDEDGNEITNETELDNILGGDYIFDWYLSTSEIYDAISTTFSTEHSSDNWYNTDRDEIKEKGAVKYAVDTYRSRGGGEDTEVMDADEIRQWQSANPDNGKFVACADLLLSLLEPENGSDPLLRTGTPAGEVFNLQVNSTEIMAMPYVHAKQGYLFCTNASPVPLPVNGSFVPVILSGIYGVGYTGDLADASVPLRLGLENISTATEITTLKMPVRGIQKATTASRLGIPQTGDVTIRLDSVELNYPEVGEVTTLNISNTNQANTVSFYLSADAGRYMEEGKQYRILIPFVQYDSNDQVLASECDGWISLPVKVVPEYQTWKGGATGKWYNDESSWAFSTRSELYNKDDVTNTTENRYSYSPLYFTKITIPEGSELALEDKEPGTGVIDLTGETGATTDIQYDLAVEDNTGNVGAYYINDVSQIYFKPKALLKNQQHLTYQKAWVEFEMGKGDANWMASPLKDVFAGDMYAPKGTGRQTTPAFTDIKYTDTDPGYDRWNPTFYQKAWDKGITYYTKDDGSTSETTTVVKSNWSIEYNDVNVPYALGKGFYASTNDFENTETDESGKQQALVRLPKADASYSYVAATRAASTIDNRPNAGKLAGNEAVKIVLTDADKQDDWHNDSDIAYADGDGTHFLIGNPYMYPLDITKFFDGNKKDDTDLFARKYWVLENGTTAAAVVGTPDVGFGANTGAITNLGQIAPMQAFFVELATPLSEGGSVEIQFTTDMMADAATTQSLDTRSYEATNPQLILTASSKQGKSVSVVTKRSDASNQYESDKDAVTLLDSELDAPTVYTVAGNYAAAVNAIHDYKNVPLGVYADADEEVELTIEGASQLVEPLYLYDAVTRSTTPIEGDSYTLNLQGSSHGRYFLTTDEGITVESDIRIYSPADGQLIIASTPSDKLKHVQVYDLSGRVVDSRQNIGMTTCQISVPGGIYIIRAESEHGEAQAKLKVR